MVSITRMSRETRDCIFLSKQPLFARSLKHVSFLCPAPSHTRAYVLPYLRKHAFPSTLSSTSPPAFRFFSYTSTAFALSSPFHWSRDSNNEYVASAGNSRLHVETILLVLSIISYFVCDNRRTWICMYFKLDWQGDGKSWEITNVHVENFLSENCNIFSVLKVYLSII